MKILALDTATLTGWAYIDDSTIESGVQDFSKRRGESNGILFMRFNKWLRETFPGVNVIIYERAHHRGGAATELCVGLTTRVQEYAASIGAEYMSVPTTTLKKFATGKGNAGKPEMIDWFKKQTGRDPIDDNEADAYGLLKFAIAELD